MTGFWKDYSEEGYLEEEDLWRAAETEPEDEGSKEIKALLNIIVGSQFLQYAYSLDAYTARKYKNLTCPVKELWCWIASVRRSSKCRRVVKIR